MESAGPQQVAEQPTNNGFSSSSSSSSSSSTSSSSPAMPSSHGAGNMAPAFMGKHRTMAAISYLNQQIQIIQEELDELDSVAGVATVCQELISSADTVPDALLPVTRGPADIGWDRWFQGTHSSKIRMRWI